MLRIRLMREDSLTRAGDAAGALECQSSKSTHSPKRSPMRSSTKHVGFLSLAVAAFAVVGCGDKFVNAVFPASATVSMQDQCDSASFNAAIGAGTCTKAGSVTLAE